MGSSYYIGEEELEGMDGDQVSEYLLIHLEINLAGLKEIHDRLNKIRNTSNSRALPWARPMECMLAHICLDIGYLEAEIKNARER